VRRNPGTTEVRNVRDGSVTFEFQFSLPTFKSVCEIVEVLFGLGNQTVQSSDGLAFNFPT
jgi:hypothetical protein